MNSYKQPLLFDCMKKKKKNNQKGITLIELMLVASIIVILLSFAVPNMMVMVERAHNSDIVFSAKRLQQTLEEFAGESQDKGWFQSYPRNAIVLMASDSWKRYTPTNPFHSAYNRNFMAKLLDTVTFTKDAQAASTVYAFGEPDGGEGDGIAFEANPVSKGSGILYIPHREDIFRAIVTSGYVSSDDAAKGCLIYYPYKSVATGTQDWPEINNDIIAGYEIRGINGNGRLIRGLKISGGESFQE